MPLLEKWTIFVLKFEAIHNKDYSVVKTFKAGLTVRLPHGSPVVLNYNLGDAGGTTFRFVNLFIRSAKFDKLAISPTVFR